MVTAICTLWVRAALVPVTVTVPLSGVGGALLDEPPPQDVVVNTMVMTSRPSRLREKRRFWRAVRDGSRRGTSSTAANRKLLSTPRPRGESDDGRSSRDVSVAALIVRVEVPLPVRLAGLSEHVVVLSPATLHERLMVPEKPPIAVAVIVSVPVPPLPIVSDELLAANEKSGFEAPSHAATNAETSTEPHPLATS